MSTASPTSSKSPAMGPARIQLRTLDGSTGPALGRLHTRHFVQADRIRADGSDKRQITQDVHQCWQPAWSPDVRQIAYVRQTDKAINLWLMDADGTNARALTEGGTNLLPSWMPDSKHIVWMITDGGKETCDDSQLHIMDTETLQSRRLFSDSAQVRFNNSMPAVSPDGQKIAFVSDRSGIRSFPDPRKGGPRIMIDSDEGWKDLPIVPDRTRYGRFAWKP